MGIAKQLFQLQELDTKLDSAQKSLKEYKVRLSTNTELKKAGEELDTANLNLEALRKEQRTADDEIKDRDARIKDFEKKLYSGEVRNSKELANLQTEIDLLKSHRSEFEDKSLKLLEQIEPLQSAAAGLSKRVADLKAAWQEEHSRLRTEVSRLETLTADLSKERQDMAASINPQTLNLYQRLKVQKGLAVSRIEQGICTRCRVTLPVADIQKTRSDQLIQCSSCGRILFLS